MKKIGKLLCVILLFVMCMYFSGVQAKADTFENQENGIITVNYNNTSSKKTLIMVEHVASLQKGGSRYYYAVPKGKNELDVPLTQGNGSYKIRICEMVAANKVTPLVTQDIVLELKNEDEVFLQSSIVVNYKVSDKLVDKAADFREKFKSDEKLIKAVHEYVVKNYTYDYAGLKKKMETAYYVPDLKLVYKNKTGICYDISAVVAGMLRSQGIEVKLVTGYTPNIDVYHAWNRIYDASKKGWYSVDLTYDVGKYAGGKGKKETMIKKESEYKDIVYTY